MSRDSDWIKSRVTVSESGCWVWNGAKKRDGYGRSTIRINGSWARTTKARALDAEGR